MIIILQYNRTIVRPGEVDYVNERLRSIGYTVITAGVETGEAFKIVEVPEARQEIYPIPKILPLEGGDKK